MRSEFHNFLNFEQSLSLASEKFEINAILFFQRQATRDIYFPEQLIAISKG